MDIETTKPRKRFSSGGLLCICAAVIIMFFAVLDIHKIGYNVLEFLYNRVWRFIKYERYDYMSTLNLVYYVFDFLADGARYLISLGLELLELISAGFLFLMGFLLTVKVRTRFMVVFSMIQTFISGIVVAVCFIPLALNMSVWMFTLVAVPNSITLYNLIFKPVFVLLNSNLTEIILPLTMAFCWFMFGLFTLIFAGGKKRRWKGTWVAPSILVGLMFGTAPLLRPGITIFDVMTKLGYTGVKRLVDLLSDKNINFMDDVLNVIGWIFRIAEDCAEGILVGFAMGLCMFFAMKWMVDPFEKEKK